MLEYHCLFTHIHLIIELPLQIYIQRSCALFASLVPVLNLPTIYCFWTVTTLYCLLFFANTFFIYSTCKLVDYFLHCTSSQSKSVNLSSSTNMSSFILTNALTFSNVTFLSNQDSFLMTKVWLTSIQFRFFIASKIWIFISFVREI